MSPDIGNYPQCEMTFRTFSRKSKSHLAGDALTKLMKSPMVSNIAVKFNVFLGEMINILILACCVVCYSA